MLDKIKWMWRVLRSKTFVVMTDRGAVVSIPLHDINTFENQLLMAAQAASLSDFKHRLEDLIGEHEDAIKLLSHRQSASKTAKTEKSGGTKVRKSTKSTKSKSL